MSNITIQIKYLTCNIWINVLKPPMIMGVFLPNNATDEIKNDT
ncbi:hypothetical protein [Methanobrevibacter sp.]